MFAPTKYLSFTRPIAIETLIAKVVILSGIKIAAIVVGMPYQHLVQTLMCSGIDFPSSEVVSAAWLQWALSIGGSKTSYLGDRNVCP
jgi:hypothetical protein